VLSEARDTRGQGLFADKDAVAVVGKRTWSLRRDTDIDRLV
jgi:phage gp46-like protein